ncbi:MAG: glycosyltransferase family 2 protein [Candidatus Magasanikbacteria bacterium]|nr:glycosyltransferase family 2 protein [Candidatus Magasanikbacteria bacterium]
MVLSIITVSWNVKDRLRACIQSVFENCGEMEIEYFVVDNASSDGTADMLAREFPQVRVIANSENKGFARANNQAIAQSTGEFVLLLNPDMRVLQETLPRMVAWMRMHSRAGVASGKLLDEQGHLNAEATPRHFPEFLDQAAIMLKVPHLFACVLDHYLWRDFDAEKEQTVDSVRGSFFMISREVLEKLKGLDERYFIWFEEVDFCKQAWNAGFEVWYVPSVTCVDYVGQSFKQQPGMWRQKQFTKSMVQYFEKWHPGASALILQCLRPLALFLTWIFITLKI